MLDTYVNFFISPKAMTDMKLISRRKLLQTTALISMQGLVPMAFSQSEIAVSVAEPLTWSDKSLPLAQHAIGAITRHPFITQACSGALPKKSFISYLSLNIEYLTHYAKSLENLAARVGIVLSLSQEGDQLRTWAKETLDVRQWCMDLYRDAAGNAYNAKRGKRFAAGEDYALFERCYALKYDVGIGMAALLPCFWVYDQIGMQIAKMRNLTNNPYAQWLEGFGTSASHESTLKAIHLADTLANLAERDDIRQQMTDVFVAGCWKELACFDAAYRSRFRNF